MRNRSGKLTDSEVNELDHVHWGTTRTRDYDELAVLAIDHRVQFKELAAECGADVARISRFKSLGLTALDTVARGDTRFGVLLDRRFGFDALCRAADLPYWIGRPIEVSKSRRDIDETLCVHDGDLVMVPRGYHPVSAAHGYDLYYLNVMAGPQRQWMVRNDPDHAWLARDSQVPA